ncbi:hypothetical protein AMTR_s00190p00045750 [Amborella trichopoda]|uniref:Uncharacterized protein n=1 Tax=Amborella trichopoda TaxID=13333 RepID=U5D7K7_AMBTC|nr:hypothetical protein AMTR_s00190p00045750 [Amborella trichopoda]
MRPPLAEVLPRDHLYLRCSRDTIFTLLHDHDFVVRRFPLLLPSPPLSCTTAARRHHSLPCAPFLTLHCCAQPSSSPSTHRRVLLLCRATLLMLPAVHTLPNHLCQAINPAEPTSLPSHLYRAINPAEPTSLPCTPGRATSAEPSIQLQPTTPFPATAHAPPLSAPQLSPPISATSRSHLRYLPANFAISLLLLPCSQQTSSPLDRSRLSSSPPSPTRNQPSSSHAFFPFAKG